MTYYFYFLLPPFSLIRDFGKQNTRGNVSKISVNHTCYQQIGSKSTNHNPLAWRKGGLKVTLVAGCDWWISIGSVWGGGGWVGVFWKFFAKKVRGPSTSQIGLMHDPSQILEQKDPTLPPPPISSRTKIAGSVAHITASVHKGVNCVVCDCTAKSWKWARMCVTPLTLLVAHRVTGDNLWVKVQSSGNMKTWCGSRIQRAITVNCQKVFCQNSTCPFGPLVPIRNTLAGNIPAVTIWTKTDTGREIPLR